MLLSGEATASAAKLDPFGTEDVEHSLPIRSARGEPRIANGDDRDVIPTGYESEPVAEIENLQSRQIEGIPNPGADADRRS